MFGRKIMDNEEARFWDRAYNIGMKNGWCSGRYLEEDGDFIVEEDRLNHNSCIIIDSIEELYKFFKYGNWCLGDAVIFKSLCFIQQVDGGDEWLTIRNFPDEAIAFESYSLQRMDYIEFSNRVGKMLRASKEQCIQLEYMEA